ncbi:MAG TPA: hypothetical protein VMR17_22655 [Xanthobacteraceae bacterium]|jgi:hypothetical protein|nr:hypothetical protein [Xanthobacteraceae bacterium]
MDWKSAVEIARDLAPVATAVAAASTAWIAYRGLEKWRSETIGKRKAELAEIVLADFYHARATLRWARSGVIFNGEIPTKANAEEEDAKAEHRKAILRIPINRLSKEAELFARLASHRYRFQALFGEQGIRPFDELASIYSEIGISVQVLAEMERWEPLPGEHPANQQIMELRKKIWGGSPDDKLSKRVDLAVSAIEEFCRPALASRER